MPLRLYMCQIAGHDVIQLIILKYVGNCLKWPKNFDDKIIICMYIRFFI